MDRALKADELSEEKGLSVLEDKTKTFIIETCSRVSGYQKAPENRDVARSSLNHGPRLPFHVIERIAQILANEIAVPHRRDWLRTATSGLLSLSLASRAINAITLPLLYRRTAYITRDAFIGTVGKGGSKGWSYTRHLYLTTDTYALLEHHYRVTFGCPVGTESKINLQRLFPRLAFVAIISTGSKVSHNGGQALKVTTEELKVELYRKIPLDDFYYLCRSSLKRNYGKKDVFVFGIQIRKLCSVKPETKYLTALDITDMVIRPTAGITPPISSSFKNSIGSGVRIDVHSFSCVIMGSIVDAGVKSTVDLILGFARLIPAISEEDHKSKRVMIRFEGALQFQCSSSVLDYFIRALNTAQPPPMKLQIELVHDISSNPKEAVMRHTKAIADTYSRNWTYNWDWMYGEDVLVEIETRFAVDPEIKRQLDFGTKTTEVWVEGNLVTGTDDGTGETNTGFSANMEISVACDNEGDWDIDQVESFALEQYPCRHVPVPAGWKFWRCA